MKADPQLLAARARAAAAHARLTASVELAKQRLSPAVVASDAVASVRAKASDLAEDVRAKATDLAEDGVEVVRERPVIAAIAASVLGLFLVRRPIGNTIARWTARDDATPVSDAS